MMKSFAAALLMGAASLMPVSGLAATVISGETQLFEAKILRPGETWTTSYTVNAPDRFVLDLAFSGTGFSGGEDLSRVRFGIDVADTSYGFYSGTSPISFAGGVINDVSVSAPFSIIYYLDAAAQHATGVTFTGSLSPVQVPEIGAEGALPAVFLVLGSIAVMTGSIRRRDARRLAVA